MAEPERLCREDGEGWTGDLAGLRGVEMSYDSCYSIGMSERRMKSNEVRAHWRDAIDFVRTGGEIVVEHYNRPVARITPYKEPAMTNQNIRAAETGDEDTEQITLVNATYGDQVPGVEISQLGDLTFLTREDVEGFFADCGYSPDNPDELVYAFPAREYTLPYGFPAETFDVPASEAQVIRDAIRNA